MMMSETNDFRIGVTFVALFVEKGRFIGSIGKHIKRVS